MSEVWALRAEALGRSLGILDFCIYLRYTYTMNIEDLLLYVTGFEWDDGNRLKNYHQHGVSSGECEQVFFNRPLILAHDQQHSQQEPRFFALGHTDSKRRLFVVFTIRNNSIRVISARDMNRKERKAYTQS